MILKDDIGRKPTGFEPPAALGAALACTIFVLLGCAFLPLLGVQNDEALFSAGIYEPLAGLAYTRSVFGLRIPLMLMSYLGALKTWLYAPLFHFCTPNVISIRLPMLLAGAASICLFFRLLARIASPRAALLGAALLATDSIYLLTCCFDWGPVALQHVLFLGALVLLVRFHQRGGTSALAGAFFLFGLALWDKAVSAWILSAVAAAGFIVFPREVRRAFTPGRAAAALAALAFGALPLVLYNGSQRLETFRSNTTLAAAEIPEKAPLLRYTLEGRALFGYLNEETIEPRTPPAAASWTARLSDWLSRRAGEPRRGLFFWAVAVSAALFPYIWWRRGWKTARPLAFALVFLAVAWLQMAATHGAGGSVHHVVLMWPVPHMLVALALAAALPRASAALVMVVAASNLLVLNEYHTQIRRNGSSLTWTDAIYPLSSYFVKTPPAGEVFLLDWGMFDALRLLNRGSLKVRVGSDPVTAPAPGESERAAVRLWASGPANVFVAHTEGSEFYPGGAPKIQALAAEAGYRAQPLALIADRHGRPRFQVFRFLPAVDRAGAAQLY
ncbi:MAG: glycosyltransferase family 39 protein [Bryobacteraceae bacterium]